MENFNLKPQNKIEKESNDSTTFEALKAFGERFGKSLKDSATAISLVLATFSYTEAQAQKTECATQTIKLTQEQSIQLDHHKQTVDSLSDVLFEEAKKHNLLKTYKEAPQNKWETDSSEHIYYKSRLASFGDKNAIIMYQKTKNKTNTLPPTSETVYKVENKSICANGKLFFLNEDILGVSNYNNPNLIKEDNFLAGNKSAVFNANPGQNDVLTSNHGFTTADFLKSSNELEAKMKSEIELVRGMK